LKAMERPVILLLHCLSSRLKAKGQRLKAKGKQAMQNKEAAQAGVQPVLLRLEIETQAFGIKH
jgi:hypothetical protein